MITLLRHPYPLLLGRGNSLGLGGQSLWSGAHLEVFLGFMTMSLLSCSPVSDCKHTRAQLPPDAPEPD